MNCEDFKTILVEAARGAADSEAFAHVAECKTCGVRFANERALSEGFARIAANSPEGPLDLESKLLAEFRKVSKRRTVFTRGRIAMAMGVAAVVILAFMWPVSAPEAPMVVRFEDPLPAMTASSTHSEASPMLALHRPARRRALRAKPMKAAEPTELANDFIPVPYSDPLSPVERAEVVRVNVRQPGGIPVPADVVLGQDGLVRAIRFLKTSQ